MHGFLLQTQSYSCFFMVWLSYSTNVILLVKNKTTHILNGNQWKNINSVSVAGGNKNILYFFIISSLGYCIFFATSLHECHYQNIHFKIFQKTFQHMTNIFENIIEKKYYRTGVYSCIYEAWTLCVKWENTTRETNCTHSPWISFSYSTPININTCIAKILLRTQYRCVALTDCIRECMKGRRVFGTQQMLNKCSHITTLLQ